MTDEEQRMPFWQHLDDLRKGLVRSLLYLGVGLCVTYNYSEYLVRFLEAPLLKILEELPGGHANLYFTGIADKFIVYLKVSILAALGLVSPLILFEVWRFVSPGLYSKEKRLFLPFIFLGSIAFIGGNGFAYYVLIPTAYDFLIQFGSPDDIPLITLSEYFSLTIKLLLVVGLIFQLPVLMMLLGRFGFLSSTTLTRFRKHAFVASAVVAAFITPTTDAFSMVIIMGPIYVLYELGILGVKLTSPRT